MTAAKRETKNNCQAIRSQEADESDGVRYPSNAAPVQSPVMSVSYMSKLIPDLRRESTSTSQASSSSADDDGGAEGDDEVSSFGSNGGNNEKADDDGSLSNEEIDQKVADFVRDSSQQTSKSPPNHVVARKSPTRTVSTSDDTRMSLLSMATDTGGNRRGSISGFFARSLAAESGDSETLRKLLQEEIELLQGDQDLDRDRIRLESFETYVLVSVMTASASFASFQASDLDSVTGFIPLFMCYVKMTCSAVSAMLGLYATIVFSLCVLYGKTALGMKKDEMFEHFVKSTGKQRIRGFQAFSLSLQCFAAEVALTVIGRMGWPAAIAAGFALYVIINDLNAIIVAAAPIFTGIIPASEPSEQKSAGSNDAKKTK